MFWFKLFLIVIKDVIQIGWGVFIGWLIWG